MTTIFNQDAHFETRAIHGGNSFQEGTGAVTQPIFATSTFANGNAHGFDYTRSGNPNFRHLESILSELEAANHTTVFSSGVAAVTAVVSSLSAGDLILAEENVYGCTYRLFHQVFNKFGLRVEYLDFTNPENYAVIEAKKPALVWIESPTNPLLKIIDIEAIATICAKHKRTLLVDNTFASSFNQRPLELGATLSLSSTTKYINGHSDCLGGAVATKDAEWADRLVFAQKALGLNPSPFDAWLIARGVKTLAMRMARHQANAESVTECLSALPGVRRVVYPFSPNHPQHDLARRQMRGGSGIVVADLGLSLPRTRAFLQSLSYFTLAESLGGVESLVCHPASMTHASVPRSVRERVGITDSLVRFSVGVEHTDDLIADLKNAWQQQVLHAASA